MGTDGTLQFSNALPNSINYHQSAGLMGADGTMQFSNALRNSIKYCVGSRNFDFSSDLKSIVPFQRSPMIDSMTLDSSRSLVQSETIRSAIRLDISFDPDVSDAMTNTAPFFQSPLLTIHTAYFDLTSLFTLSGQLKRSSDHGASSVFVMDLSDRSSLSSCAEWSQSSQEDVGVVLNGSVSLDVASSNPIITLESMSPKMDAASPVHVTSHSTLIIDPGQLSPAKGLETEAQRTDLSVETGRSLSLTVEGRISGTDLASQVSSSNRTLSGGIWIGMGLGLVILLAGSAMLMWWVMRRRKGEVSDETPSSMDFGVETDEESRLAAAGARLLSATWTAMEAFGPSDDMRDAGPVSLRGTSDHVFEESFV
jgi:hypothetical protein